MEKVVPVSLESQVSAFSRVINKSVPFMLVPLCYDQTTAEKAISSVLATNKAQIAKFIKGKDSQIIIKDSVPYPVGVVLKRNASTAMPASGVLLVLRRDKHLPDGYRIHTGYAE
jgi:Asp-tRNA(Asn)/Glu-tRNA(Gln) amidotransferase B subunit